ncbi:class I SAM-dependent methyltransferase [Mangrovibacterium diazotrophicum]|uniref:Methyltransferase family protein n=1 Tax=Mangrovibacterium diazotrophicum TaxID=1261403 RepID=A0A419W8E4_9BACT|nr:methyltransferase domain-containing protein [Mangrovibacterium diazotrophicum]RKD91729.1 methyltransferase family protein [Mangrovibacterium diazotrophicum]
MNIFAKEEIADAYDSYYETEFGKKVDELEKAALLEVIKDIPRCKLLELGAGTGHWTEFFVNQGFTVTATDVSEAMFAHARQKLVGKVEFRKADMLNLPNESESVDAIAVIAALEFCEDQMQAFANIYRVLKPKGWLIVGCLNANSTLGKVKNDDPVYRYGDFMTKSDLETYLESFGEPTILECVHLSDKMEVLDGTPEAANVPGAFMAACVQKID